MFVNRCSLLENKCNFSEAEKQEHIIELIIASTPVIDFQKELINKPENLTLSETITLGRQYEAATSH
jgi:hypothetical protein